MIKLQAILRILFHKRYVLITDDGKGWWFNQQNMRIYDMNHAAKCISDLAKEQLDGDTAVNEVQEILKKEQ